MGDRAMTVAANGNASVADELIFEALSDEQKRAAEMVLKDKVEIEVVEERNVEVDDWYERKVVSTRTKLSDHIKGVVEKMAAASDRARTLPSRKEAFNSAKQQVQEIVSLIAKIPVEIDA
jgi:hypothetical protein